MTQTYLDAGAGVAGDMLLGALIDLGLPLKELERQLQRAIPMKGWRLAAGHTERKMWPARSFRVEGDRPFGSVEKMKRAVRKATMPALVKDRALAILTSLEWAEAQAHGHSHGEFDAEGLGLLDTLVDVLGNSWGFWRLGLTDVAASPVNTGRVAPASVHLLARSKIPTYSNEAAAELATPTGIAILSHIVKEFTPRPLWQIRKAGYGAGQKDFPNRPNVLAIYQGESVASRYQQEPVLLLETAIDDMDPRLYPHVTDLLFKAGALDTWWVSAGMKKGRPGILYSVLCRPAEEEKLLNILFTETTTLGVRRVPLDRWVLPRESKGLRKIARLPGGRQKSQVEYELARQKAAAVSLPLKKLLK